MPVDETRLGELVELLERHAPDEGLHATAVDGVGLSRMTRPMERTPLVYEPAVFLLARGSKACHIGGRSYEYRAGDYLVVFLPMPLEVTVTDVSPESPGLMLGLRLDLTRLATISLRLDDVDPSPQQESQSEDPTGISTSPMSPRLLDAAIRMLRTLDDPIDAAMFGDAILDEIHYVLLREDRDGSLRVLLQQRQKIQQIARAVDHLGRNLDRTVPVPELAELVNMSTSTFHRNFKEVMHLTPLQYAKSIKLHRAQALLRAGRTAAEAGRAVGYRSAAQFSREHRRQFGYSPSDTGHA